MATISAGLLLYRKLNGQIEVLLAHPGGPFFAKKDADVWSLPKGEVENGEDLLTAAEREFEEETGMRLKEISRSDLVTRSDLDISFLPLGAVKYTNGKIVHAWAFESDSDPATLQSNTFQLEWPPHSGRMQEVPEMDRFAFFPLAEARRKILPAQVEFIDRLEERLRA